MHAIETTAYVLLALGLCAANVWHLLTNNPQAVGLGVLALTVVVGTAMARMVWTGTANARYMKRVIKEINKRTH